MKVRTFLEVPDAGSPQRLIAKLNMLCSYSTPPSVVHDFQFVAPGVATATLETEVNGLHAALAAGDPREFKRRALIEGEPKMQAVLGPKARVISIDILG